MKTYLHDENKVYRKKPYYLSDKDLNKMCEIINQIKEEQYTVTKDALEYRWKDGKTLYPRSASEFEKIAFSLADMHIILKKLDYDYCPRQFYTHFPNTDEKTIELMMSFFEKSIYSCGTVKECLVASRKNLRDITLPGQLIHGDAHPYNCLIYDGNITWIDYTDVHYDSKVIDLAWFIIYSVCWDEEYKHMKRIDLKCMHDFLCAYNLKNQLERIEIDKFPYVFCVLLVYSLFSVHSFWRENKKCRYIDYNISMLENNLHYIMGDLKWNFQLQY